MRLGEPGRVLILMLWRIPGVDILCQGLPNGAPSRYLFRGRRGASRFHQLDCASIDARLHAHEGQRALDDKLRIVDH